jgi:hypothetical protein
MEALAKKNELSGMLQEERGFTVVEAGKSIDSMNELYRLLQEGIDDVENGRTKSMRDSIQYIREKIN